MPHVWWDLSPSQAGESNQRRMLTTSTNFSLSSVSRNRFLQPPTGLFGGDEWCLSAYTPPTGSQYGRSETYSRTMTGWTERNRAYVGMQYEPLACWYAAGTVVVQEVGTTVTLLQWDLSPALWNTVRLPNQCVSLAHRGVLVYASPVVAYTTRIQLALETAKLPESLRRAGEVATFTLRPRAPSAVVAGPVLRVGPRTVLMQGANLPTLIPVPYKALLHLGGHEASTRNPLLVAAHDAPAVARTNVYGIETVVVDEEVGSGGDSLALRSLPMPITTQTWYQLTPHLALGVLAFTQPGVPTGWAYQWP